MERRLGRISKLRKQKVLVQNDKGVSLLQRTLIILTIGLAMTYHSAQAQLFQGHTYHRSDTLRGSISLYRAWWDVEHYQVFVSVHPEKKYIKGSNHIQFTTRSAAATAEQINTNGFTGKMGVSATEVLREKGYMKRMQLDLQYPMQLDSVVWEGRKLPVEKDTNCYFVSFPEQLEVNKTYRIEAYYSGFPREAKNAPWDGGWVWSRAEDGTPWITVACQGLGASVWYPCKDHQSDEAGGAGLSIEVPKGLKGIGNGRLEDSVQMGTDRMQYRWVVKNPINNYNIVPYIGNYTAIRESYAGEKGELSCTYWVQPKNEMKAQKQFAQVKPMLKCFEYWFGPYPFYEDGYQLVEAPHLGMEHQSAIAYGNKYVNGYRGTDLSGSGFGHTFDFILIHESGHEWFGNNITARDIADMWIHESFTNYSEALYLNCTIGDSAGNAYVQGIRKNIQNDVPIVGTYHLNQEGSGDMYYKGANMIHMIRQWMNNDEAFRILLRKMNQQFYHQTVSGAALEAWIIEETKLPLKTLFQQYLRTTQIPKLELKSNQKNGKTYIQYRYTDCIPGFTLKTRLQTAPGHWEWVMPTEDWQEIEHTWKEMPAALKQCKDPNYYLR